MVNAKAMEDAKIEKLSRGRVLVLDDEKNITFVIQAMLERAGYETLVFNDSSLAMAALSEEEVDLVVTDLYMPGPGGMEILAFCQKTLPQLPVVLITAYGTVESAVAALKRGAFDFITKPFEQTELLNIVSKAVATYQKSQNEPVPLSWNVGGVSGGEASGISNSPGATLGMTSGMVTTPEMFSIIGNSPQIQEIYRVISKIAQSSSTVLISGESGTGKELVAFEIHRNSARAKKPFVKINCAAIPSTLIESELFGYERGAFTGAVTSKPGRFELAHEGTIFLDEVAEMPLEMQVKLLRVLQEQEFERVGGVSSTKVDVRIITATNRDLDVEVKNGRFREDLFYRLNVVPIVLPSLRERREDIELLVQFFLARFVKKLGKKVTAIEPEAMHLLKTHAWPGNIRQLENALERMVLMADHEVLRASDLPDEMTGALVATGDSVNASASFKEIVRRQTQSLERGLIDQALQEMGGNITRTAEKLGLSRKGLQLKMKELGIRRGVRLEE